MTSLDIHAVRSQFPALQRAENGRPVAWFDGPGGSQVPQSVIDAISGFLARGGSNLGGAFTASRDSEEAEDARPGGCCRSVRNQARGLCVVRDEHDKPQLRIEPCAQR
jgi:hypothetical protein